MTATIPGLVGELPTKNEKLISWILPSRQIRSFSFEERALTTDAPTPCRPPEAV